VTIFTGNKPKYPDKMLARRILFACKMWIISFRWVSERAEGYWSKSQNYTCRNLSYRWRQ